MNRRKFVVGAGGLIGAGVLASSMRSESDSAPSAWTERGEDSLASAGAGVAAGKIDVHRHIVTPAMHTLLGRRNLNTLAGVALPEWSPEAFMASLQTDAVHAAITSAVLPGIHCDVGELAQFSRTSNEYSRSLADRHPGRIGFFAHLPLPYTDQACAEAVYALDSLAADGVVLMASNAGKFLGDPAFDELMHELNARSAVVFVHPNIPPSTELLGLNTPLSVLEYPCDLTRAGLNLILSGTMERFHKIRWILAHAGGFLPYVAWRVSLANAMPEYGETATQGVLTYLRSFYLDTATSVSRSSMATLQELVEPSRLLFGSDAPFTPEQQTQRQLAELVKTGFWSSSLAQRVQRNNALGLFPRYRQDGERVDVARVFEPESVVGQAKRKILAPVRSLAQKLRE